MKAMARTSLFLILGLLAASLAPAAPPPNAEVSTELTQLVKGNSAFALALYKQLAQQEKGNILFSPYSISTALAMTYAGARARTAEQMAQVLGFKGIADIHPLFNQLQQLTAAQMKNGLSLDVANSLWGRRGYPFNDDFQTLLKTHYGAGLERVNFRDRVNAAQLINKWVAGKTHERITEIIKPDLLDDLTVLILVNAVYFKAAWASPFAESETRDAPFHLVTQKDVQVRMMTKHYASFPYYEDAQDKVQVLELPYRDRPAPEDERERFNMEMQPKNENGLVMDIILPSEVQDLAGLDLSVEKLERWMNGLKTGRFVHVKIPKFELSGEFKLEKTLPAMGMRDAFIDGAADFSGMITRPELKHEIYLYAALHKAWVRVDEKGTEATGATAIAVIAGGVDDSPHFTADHPFLFLIRDKRTGSILFLGRVMQPNPVKDNP